MENGNIHILEGFLIQEKEHILYKKRKNICIGVSKEISENETRVALTPETVGFLIEEGYGVRVEKGAGLLSGFKDMDYSEFGAEITDKSTTFQCDLIFKIVPPTLEEIRLMKEHALLFSSLCIYEQSLIYFQTLLAKKITAFAYELIKDEENTYPFLQSMSEICGLAIPLIAAEYLAHPKYGKGILLGGITGLSPSEVVVIGTGVVAQHAIPVFQSLGASVKVFDFSLSHLRRIKNILNSPVYTGYIHDTSFKKAVESADVVVASLYSDEYLSPCVVSKDMVKNMEQGSLIMDISIDQGGCTETSRPTSIKNPVYQELGITHYCVPNIAARFPNSASHAIAKNIVSILQKLSNWKEIHSVLNYNISLQESVYTYGGMLTNAFISSKYGIRYHDLKFIFNKFWT